MERLEKLILPLKENYQLFIIKLCDIQKEEISASKEIVDDYLLEQIKQFSFEKDQNRRLIVQALLRLKLAEFLNCRPKDIVILRDDFGKPYVKNHSPHFSLSYSNDYALLGLSIDKLLGVDIEEMNPDRVMVTSPILHSIEKKEIQGSEHPVDAFYSFWCAKESLLKALGTGFTENKPPPLTRSSKGFFTLANSNAVIYTHVIYDHKIGVCLLEEI